MGTASKKQIPLDRIEQLIVVLRGQRVMLDRDLAALYGVPVKRLNEQVKRNRDRFPEDFMFQLTAAEAKEAGASRSQIATLKRGRNEKYRPFAFSEFGAIMLANVLRSKVAVNASIQVVRAFVSLRRAVATNELLLRKVDAIEARVAGHDTELTEMVELLRKLLAPPAVPRRNPIGFLAQTKTAAGD